jgi:hypothetical protein
MGEFAQMAIAGSATDIAAGKRSRDDTRFPLT